MALFFNLKLLESQSTSNPEKLIALLRFHYEGKTIANKRNKYNPSTKSLVGNSFILNPVPILYNKDTDPAYLSQYVKLAGRRDLSLFKLYRFIALDLSYYPDIDLNSIKTNPLLNISNHQIRFKFEEIYHGTKIRRDQGQSSQEVS